jgi:hypothetical protein
MDEPNMDLQHSTSKIQGAVSGSEFGENAHFHHDELPLIVWLRGDESYAGDFSLSADEAMKALGIKRSRLTQISGKELRVGRIRVDRYIRPVYRQSDIDAYLEWTRPTATHIKSSDVLLHAATELRSGSREMADQISRRISDAQNALIQSYEAVATETYRIQRESFRLLTEQLESHRQEDIERAGALTAANTNQMTMINERMVNLEQRLQQQIEDVQTQIQQFGNQTLATFADSHTAAMRAVDTNGDMLRELTSSIDTTKRSTEESYELAFESFASIRETMEQQARFHRGVAEALAKIIEVQRELLQIRNIALLQQDRAGFGRPKYGLRMRRQPSAGRALQRRKSHQET